MAAVSGKAVRRVGWCTAQPDDGTCERADISRFHPHQLTHSYITKRGAQQYREVYDIIHPAQEMDDPRGLRTLPYHDRLEELGAYLVENAGWERPQWFRGERGAARRLHRPRSRPYRMGEPVLVSHHRRGAQGRPRACRPSSTSTPFTKLDVSGPGALAFMERIAANRMDKPVGAITYTSMLTPTGRHQVRPHRDALGDRRVHGRHRRWHGGARQGLDTRPPSRRRLGHHHRREHEVVQHRRVGTHGP